MEKKVKLSVLGFSYNQTQSGTYGLVMAEEKGIRRILIIVGMPEAQSIAFKLHNTEPPRPLSHDIIQALIDEYNITLQEVFIHKYNDGIYYSKLIFTDSNGVLVTLDSRTSDAIAIALRTNSPIYTTEEIMQNYGLVITEDNHNTLIEDDLSTPNLDKEVSNYSLFSESELDNMLAEAINEEDYEQASTLRDEIEKRKIYNKKEK
ncbi:MAG: bifunctional nuclease domain-containing protein [Dysgonomonas sp.]